MFFYLSKIIWFLLDPGNLLFVLFGLGVVLLFTRFYKSGRMICVMAMMFFIIAGVLPTGQYMMAKLEYRFQKPDKLPETLDGIIVLGGIVDQNRTFKEGKLSLQLNRDRIDVLAPLSRRYPEAPILFTSGSASLKDQSVKEADLVEDYIRNLILNPERLILERESRNTYENVLFSHKLVQPSQKETWLLVTSASHMPRAIGIFRKQSWNVLPYAVHYQTWPQDGFKPEPFFRIGLARFQSGLHEWLGLFMYYMTGKTSELFPQSHS